MKELTPAQDSLDFSDWATDRLLSQRRHLEGILAVSAGQRDPQRPQLRAEHEAVCAEITRRTSTETQGHAPATRPCR